MIPGIDMYIVASIAIKALPKAKDTYDPNHESGATFATYAFKRIYWDLLEGMKNREVFVERSLNVPASERDKVSFVKLDQKCDDRHISPSEIIPSASISPDTTLEAKGLLWEASDPIAVMLGMLRVIPFRQPQRTIDAFESFYGLNGRRKETLAKVGKTWNVSVGAINKIVLDVWQKLTIAKSPIVSRLELNNALKRVADLEEVVGEPYLITPSNLTDIERFEILGRFKAEKERRETGSGMNPYQLCLDPAAPHHAETRGETMVLAVCSATGMPLTKLRGPSSRLRESRARHVAAYLLDNDLHVDFERIGELIGRRKDMAKHGKYQTAREIRDGNAAVIALIEMSRRLYVKAMSPKPHLLVPTFA